MKKISIIIPVLNEEKCLSTLLPSIASQEGVESQVIIADAGSTDSTRAIAKRYKAKVVKGGLPAVGRNSGTKYAKNERIAFFDADIEIPPGFLKKCIEELERKKADLGVVIARARSDKLLDKFLFFLWNCIVVLTQKIYPHAIGACIFSTKTLHKKINGFRTDISLGEDSNYALKASKAGKLTILKEKIYTSARRLAVEGRWNMFKKMFLCGVHRIFIGEATGNKFNYKFDYDKKKKY